MDAANYIERYAFFSFSPDEYVGTFWSSVENGTLNSLGQWWRDHEAARAYADFQDNKDCNGVTNGYAFIDNCSTCVSGNTKAIIEDSCGGSVQSKALVDTIEEANTIDSIYAYPNPVIDYLNIDSSTANTEVTVFTILGQRLFSNPINSGKNTINISNLNSGVYILKFKNGKHLSIVKK